jgi:hypothetical protein
MSVITKVWAIFISVMLIALARYVVAGARPIRLAKELRNRQAKDGLSLLQLSDGAIRQLIFSTGKLRELVKLPREIGDFPGPPHHWASFSLNWKQQKLAGMGEDGLFVLDLATGKMRWYKDIRSSARMSLSHKGDKLANQDFGTLVVVDLVTGRSKKITEGIYLRCLPQWSPDDNSVCFYKWEAPWDNAPMKPGEVMIADLKEGRSSRVGHGFSPSWEPEGGRLTVRRSGPWYEPLAFWSVSPSGGKAKKIGPMGEDLAQLLLYSPDGKYAVYERGYRWDFNIKGFEYGEVAVIRLADKKTTPVYGPYKRHSWTDGDSLPLIWALVEPPGKKHK